MNRLQLVLTVLITAIVLTFAVQNLEPVTVEFIIWRLETSPSVLVLVSFLAGSLAGMGSMFFKARKKRKPEVPAEKVPSPRQLKSSPPRQKKISPTPPPSGASRDSEDYVDIDALEREIAEQVKREGKKEE